MLVIKQIGVRPALFHSFIPGAGLILSIYLNRVNGDPVFLWEAVFINLIKMVTAIKKIVRHLFNSKISLLPCFLLVEVVDGVAQNWRQYASYYDDDHFFSKG